MKIHTENVKKSQIEIMRDMIGGFTLTQILYTAVKLEIPDHPANGSKQSHTLALAVNANPLVLKRFLRMMVVVDLLAQEEDGSFGLSPLGELLRADHPDSMRNRILYVGEVNYQAALGMSHAVITGEPGFDHVFGMSFFDYFSQNPQIGTLFNELMRKGVNDRIAGVVAVYDFSKAKTIVDVGGGNGSLITAILQANPSPQGIIFDVPAVIVEAKSCLTQKGLLNRCKTIPGNFFVDSVPPGGEIYLLSNIIHDWDDEHSIQILRNCRATMPAGNKLLLIEQVMPERAADAPVTVSSDLSMMLFLRGREHTKSEYQELLLKSNLQLTSIIPFEPSRIYHGRRTSWAIIECEPEFNTRI